MRVEVPSFLKSTFRLWWQRPRDIADVPEERTISFLELFYDLAYVAIIIQLTHTLAGHLDLQTFLEYVGLYAMVWFAWINGSLYHELHGNNDIRTRVFTFLQMFALVWMGIFVDTAFSADGYQGFAYAYGGFIAVVGFMWWRTGVHDSKHRPLSNPYAIAFAGATALFLYSTRLELEVAQQLWFGAIAFMLLFPFISAAVQRNVDAEHMELSQRIRPSIVERFGLLTIIILGENLISIVGGASYLGTFTFSNVVMIALSIFIVFSLWFVYFGLIAERLPKQTMFNRMSWMYLHLGVTMSIGLVAVGLLNLIEYVKDIEPIDRWFITFPVAAFLLVVASINSTLQIKPKSNAPLYRIATLVALVSAVGIIVVGLLDLPSLATLTLTWLLLSAPVFVGVCLWIRLRSKQLSAKKS